MCVDMFVDVFADMFVDMCKALQNGLHPCTKLVKDVQQM